MGVFTDAIAAAFRDFVTAGVPGSGDHEPVKSEIRALGPLIEAMIGVGLGTVGVAKTTKDLLDADLAHAANVTALVYADSTDANNDLYVKVGGSGTGSWTNTGALHAIMEGLAQPYVDLAEAAALSVPGAVFSKSMATMYPRDLFKRLHIRGGDPTHQYILSSLKTSSTQFTFDVTDLTEGVAVARLRYLPGGTINYASVETIHKATQDTLPDYSGIEVDAEMDFTNVVVGETVYTYDTVAEGGIDSQNVYPIEAVRQAIFDAPREVIRIGASEAETTLAGTLEGLYDDGEPPANPNNVACRRANFKHLICLDLVDVGVNPTVAELIIPDSIMVRGRGQRLIKSDVSDAVQVFEAPYSNVVEDLELYTASGYAVHDDNAGNNSIPAESGDERQHWTINKLWRRVGFIGGPSQDDWLYGCGISSYQYIRFEDCWGDRENMASTDAIFGFHTSMGTTLPPLIEMARCRSSSINAPAVQVISGTYQTVRHILSLDGCDFHLVSAGNTMLTADAEMYDLAADRRVWDVRGTHAGAAAYDDVGMVVLGTTAGLTPTGTAAALIFGTVDSSGFGNKLILEGSIRSLGARLGDCSGVNKTLTIGGVTHTFTTNLTAVSNATIIAAINATITLNPVAEVRLDRHLYPDIGHKRLALNSSGSAIAAKRFVKLGTGGTITLADGDDDIFGWTLTSIATGASGTVIVNPLFARHYFDTNISGTITGPALGKFGVTAGVLDAGALIKKGVVLPGGVMRLYR